MNVNDDGKVLLDIYERLGKMDAKIDDIKDIREKAENAHSRATQAYDLGIRNKEGIEELNEEMEKKAKSEADNKKWLIALAVPTILSIVGTIMSIFQ